MNRKKRGLALLLCICMLFTLMPMAAFADGASTGVVYGSYTGDEWSPTSDMTDTIEYPIDNSGNTLTLSKTATPVAGADNKYNVTLQVVTITTTTANSAATVLVIDVSGSMKYCADCGGSGSHTDSCDYKGSVKTSQTRLAAAKTAAKDFINSYRDTTNGSERYVAVVAFSAGIEKNSPWYDVSTAAGYKALVGEGGNLPSNSIIGGLSAGGGTNLDYALQTANGKFADNTVKDISAKNVVALTDGIPTVYGQDETYAHGTYGCPDNNAATAASALTLRATAKVYTVCFGVSGTVCWEKDSYHSRHWEGWSISGDWVNENHESDGPTVGNFLKDSIATSETGKTYAYNADNTTELNTAFANIAKNITSGLSTGTVTDGLPTGVSFVGSTPTKFTASGSGYTWTLEENDATVKTGDGKNGLNIGQKSYTYTCKYTVQVNPGAFNDDNYHPLNTETYFTAGNRAYQFPVPGVKFGTQKFNVTYDIGDHGTTLTADAKEVGGVETKDADNNVTKIVYNDRDNDSTTPAAPAVTPADGYYFTGWTPTIASTVTANATYTAQYAAKKTITIVANDNSKPYDGTALTPNGYSITIGSDKYESNTFTLNGKTYTVTGVTISGSQTDAGSSSATVNASTVSILVVNDDGTTTNVTDQFTVNTKNGKLTVAKKDVTITSADASKAYDGTPLTKHEATAVGFAGTDGATYTFTGSQTIPGNSYNTFTYTLNAGTNANNYNITTKNGTLTVIATYTVTYQFVDENGTITELNGVTLVVPADSNRYALDAEVTVLSNTNTVDGYTFDGWTATDADGNTVAINDGKLKMPASDVTITGTFSPVAGLGYTVEYYWIGDKGSEAPEKQIAPSKTVAGDEYCIFGYEIWPGDDAWDDDIDGYTMIPYTADEGETDPVYKNVYFTTDPTKNVFRIYYYKNVDLTVADAETVYNGKAQEHSGAYTVTAQVDDEVLTGLVFDGVTASGSGTAANTYDVKFNGDPWGTVDTTGKYIVAGYSKGHLVINPRPLMITGASLGEKTYNGSAFTTDQYTWNTPTAEKPDVGLLEGDTIGNLAYLLTGTDAGNYTGEFSNPDNETFSIDNIIIHNAGGDEVQSNYDITIELGFLKINPITDEVVVEIKGHTDTKYYNGKIQEVNGYDVVDISNALYSASYVSLKEPGSDHAEGKDVGTYYMGLDSGSFVNNNQNFVNVKFVVEDGWLKITNQPVDTGIYTKIIVKITGNSASEVYDGTEKSVEGYTVEISDPRYTEKDFKFTGTAEAKGTFVGEYPMGLEADQFVNINRRFKNVEFIIVEDGVLTITARPITITAGSAEGWVTDCPITCDEWTSTPPAPGDTVVSVKITGVQNGPGSSPNVPSDAVIKNEAGKDVTGNYDITYVNGLLVAKDLLEKEDHFNYVIGYPDGSVQPNGNITRAEVATIFYRLLTDEARAKYTTTDNSFSDIKAGEWYTKAIATLENANIIGGYPDGTFKPNAPITRAEMATIIAKFANLDENGKSFNDIKGHWAQSYVELAAGNGWINGYEDGTFRPDQNISRAETFAMINRVLDRQVESVDDLLPTSQMNMWSDNLDPTQWYYKDVQEATNYHKCDRVNESKYETWTEKVPDIDWAKIQY